MPPLIFITLLKAVKPSSTEPPLMVTVLLVAPRLSPIMPPSIFRVALIASKLIPSTPPSSRVSVCPARKPEGRSGVIVDTTSGDRSSIGSVSEVSVTFEIFETGFASPANLNVEPSISVPVKMSPSASEIVESENAIPLS